MLKYDILIFIGIIPFIYSFFLPWETIGDGVSATGSEMGENIRIVLTFVSIFIALSSIDMHVKFRHQNYGKLFGFLILGINLYISFFLIFFSGLLFDILDGYFRITCYGSGSCLLGAAIIIIGTVLMMLDQNEYTKKKEVS